MQVICILPSLFISLPKPAWVKFGGWSEGDLVAIATSTAFLLWRGGGDRRTSEQSHFTQTSAFESHPGTLWHPWVTLLLSPPLRQQHDAAEEEPPAAPCRQGGPDCKAEDGQHLQKIPACPMSSWAPKSEPTSVLLEDIFTMLEKDRVHRHLEPFGTLYLPIQRHDLALQGGRGCCATSQRSFNTQVWGVIPFYGFSCCIPQIGRRG